MSNFSTKTNGALLFPVRQCECHGVGEIIDNKGGAMEIILSANAAYKKRVAELKEKYKNWRIKVMCGPNYFPANQNGCGTLLCVTIDDMEKCNYSFNQRICVTCPCCGRKIALNPPADITDYILHGHEPQ